MIWPTFTCALEKGYVPDSISQRADLDPSQSPACKGQVFLAANPSPESLKEILDSVVRVTGLKGYKAKEATDRKT